jgi:predicted ribosome-associated RNA-binding protein Tma20
MFKKERDVTERSRTLLKNKEVRSFKAEVAKQFPSLSEDALQVLLPNKAELHVTKLANRTLLYGIDQKVLFYDYQGRNQLFPTLHSLWLCPGMMRTLYTYGPVSKFVLRGADFMVPGLATTHNLDGLREGEKVSISIVGNPLPFAVGESAVHDMHLVDAQGRKAKGKAVTVMHCFGDLLVSSKVFPNEGFTAEEIFPVEKVDDAVRQVIDEALRAEDSDNDELDAGCDHDKKNITTTDTGTGNSKELVENDQQAEMDEVSDSLPMASLQVTTDLAGLDEDREKEERGDETPGETAETTQYKDDQLMETLILACKYVIKDKQLPMLVSSFWSTLQR